MRESSSDLHAEPEYIKEVQQPGLQITEFIKGRCFICGEATEILDAYIHLACALAYEDRKKENLKIFMAQQKGVKSR